MKLKKHLSNLLKVFYLRGFYRISDRDSCTKWDYNDGFRYYC